MKRVGQRLLVGAHKVREMLSTTDGQHYCVWSERFALAIQLWSEIIGYVIAETHLHERLPVFCIHLVDACRSGASERMRVMQESGIIVEKVEGLDSLTGRELPVVMSRNGEG